MWRYLILNILWFSMLYLVHFYGSKKSRLFVLTVILLSAFYMLFQKAVDPFTWFYYGLFSLIVFWAAGQFNLWVTAATAAIDRQIEDRSRRFEMEKFLLGQKTVDVDTLRKKADEISNLYDKMKEMSKSSDMIETFVVLGEAVFEAFHFSSIKLIVTNSEIYELDQTDFQVSYDRKLFLKERDKLKAELERGESLICENIRKNAAPVFLESLSAHPVMSESGVSAIILFNGFQPKDNAILSVLVQRFASEMKRIRLYQQIETLAITDGLTGVYVRRHLIERLEGELDRSQRFGLKLSFLMIDIDHFKRFNDEHGHLVGDVVLKQVCDTIKKNTREVDLVGRYGGEEFGVLLIETDEEHALLVADRIRKSIAEKIFKAYDESLRVTISVGCATNSIGLNDAYLLIEAADLALYQAKREGRDRVCVAEKIKS